MSLDLIDLNDYERSALGIDCGLAIEKELRKVGITKRLMMCFVLLDQEVRFVSGWTNFEHDDAEFVVEKAAKKMCDIAGVEMPLKLKEDDDE